METLAARPIVLRLAYHGRVEKKHIAWRYVPAETRSRLDELLAEGFVLDTGSELQLTRKGWLQYVNIMYYLSPDRERLVLDQMVEYACQQPGRITYPEETQIIPYS